MFTFDGDVKCLARRRRYSVVGVTFKHVIGVTSYVAKYQLVTDTDQSTLISVVYNIINTVIIVVRSSISTDQKDSIDHFSNILADRGNGRGVMDLENFRPAVTYLLFLIPVCFSAMVAHPQFL